MSRRKASSGGPAPEDLIFTNPAEVHQLAVEPAAAPAEEHADIGQWEAVHWRGRPMWRHRRLGTTQARRSEVWKLRNLK